MSNVRPPILCGKREPTSSPNNFSAVAVQLTDREHHAYLRKSEISKGQVT